VSVKARVERLERAVQRRERKPTLLLKTYDNETFAGPEDQVFTEADLVELDQDFDIVVIEYTDHWRSPGESLT